MSGYLWHPVAYGVLAAISAACVVGIILEALAAPEYDEHGNTVGPSRLTVWREGRR